MIDLHMHSLCSDGTDEPEALARRVLASGVSAAALTDHDTTAGNAAFGAVLEEAGVRFIPGCEISCLYRGDDGGRSAHILGYFIDDGPTAFQDTLLGLMEDRGTRNERLLAALRDLGYTKITAERIAEIARKDLAAANRPSFATALVEAYPVDAPATGIAPELPTGFRDNQDVFDRLLGNDGPVYIPKAHLTPKVASSAAAASGGVTVIAHPLITFCSGDEASRWSLQEKRDVLDDVAGQLSADGVIGMEVYYARHAPEEIEMLLELTSAHGLVATGGSDFHGDNKPDLEIGIGVRDLKGTSRELCVPDEVVDQLSSRRPQVASA